MDLGGWGVVCGPQRVGSSVDLRGWGVVWTSEGGE